MAGLTKRSPPSTRDRRWASRQSPWEPEPLRPRLGDGEVHVWRADLDATSHAVLDLLSADERTRAERILSECTSRRWRSARGVLRELLGRYLERDPRSLRFTAEANGKPALLRIAPHTHGKPVLLGDTASAGDSSAGTHEGGPYFNLSHSRELALFVFSADGQVGVDAELTRRRLDGAAVATRAFGVAESARLRELEPLEREREFLRLWVRREAALKCVGTGLSGPCSRGANGEPPFARIWLAELDVGPRAVAAVACQRRRRELCCWDWSTR